MHLKLHTQKSKIGGLLDLKVEIKLDKIRDKTQSSQQK